MKSPLFFAKLPAAAFFLFTGMQPAAAQRVPDGGAAHFLPYALPCLEQGRGRPAVSSSVVLAVVDCKIRPALRLSRSPVPAGMRWMQGRVAYGPVSGLPDVVVLPTGIVPTTPWSHRATGFTGTSDQGLRGVLPRSSARAAPADGDPPSRRPPYTVKLVLMGAALALLVLGVGHTTARRW